MSDTHAEMAALADRFFTAITSGDADGVRACYAPDAAIWHNNDGLTQDVDANARVLRWVHANVADYRYEDVRREYFDGGWVQQHVLRGRARSGADVAIPACIVFRVRDGRIAALDEYLDSAHVATLMS